MSIGALLAMVALLVANGFFVAAEFAFTAANRATLEQRTDRTARAALTLIRHLSLTLAGAQLGITMASLLLGFVAEPAVASVIEALVGSVVQIRPDVLHSIALVVSLLIVVFLHMVVGEMAPKNIAITAPERSALLMALPFRAYAVLFRPAIAVLNGVANLLLRLVGVEPREALEVAHTADDLAAVIASGRRAGIIEELAHRMLTGAIHFSERAVSEVMVPRPDVVAVPAEATPADVERTVVEEGMSRIPVYRGDLDDVVGFVHAKDLLAVEGEARHRPLDPELIRPLIVVPETAPVRPLLAEMQRTRNHMALVIDEHGTTAGLVTLEDIAEELVGDIRDEHDIAEAGIHRVGASRFLVPGGLRTDRLQPLGPSIPEGEYDTVGGFVMARLGRIPRRGDRVVEDGWTFRVRHMEGRRVVEVEITRA